jgi:hypothetical protein
LLKRLAPHSLCSGFHGRYWPNPLISKSFLFLFFKKETLSFFSYETPVREAGAFP